jgi:hypothetical protein
MGIRSDIEWVRRVADLPEAQAGIRLYNVPLTRAEIAIIESRADDLESALDAVNEYGALHPSEWAGATKDPRIQGLVVRFTGHLADHRSNLRRWIAPNIQVQVEQARWSLSELTETFHQIEADLDFGAPWFAANRIHPVELYVDTASNQVALGVSSTRDDLDVLIENRYDAVGMLRVTSDGTGVQMLPTGSLSGRVLDASGRPVVGAVIELGAKVVGAGPDGDTGYKTDQDGAFRIKDIEAVTYTVFVYLSDGADGFRLAGSTEATVVAGKSTSVVVRL